MSKFTPLRNYAGFEHILNAIPTFAHQNGNVYGVAIEKQAGVRQLATIYRVRPGSNVAEEVHRYVGGGIDSAAQIAAGGCVIDPTGALHTWASAVPIGNPSITKTGFVGGFWEPIPGIDDPWGGGGGVNLLPAVATAPAWEAHSLTTGILVDIPSVFNVPRASAYLVRFTVNAPVANVRGRAGTEAVPYFFTVNSRPDGSDEMQQGWVPGPSCYISPAQGTPTVWFQVVGWSG